MLRVVCMALMNVLAVQVYDRMRAQSFAGAKIG
jgi:hypothetical protein